MSGFVYKESVKYFLIDKFYIIDALDRFLFDKFGDSYFRRTVKLWNRFFL